MVDPEYERYQAVAQRHYAREASTLQLTTFISAGTLAFLGIMIARGIPFDWKYYLAAIGFGSLGIAYHELTTLTVDRKELIKDMRPMEDKLGVRQPTRWDKFYQFARWFAFRLAIAAPVLGLLRIWGPLGNIDLLVFTVLIWPLYPLVASVFHHLFLEDC